ncbi:hypothetical protein VNI00_008194 [Paramarasmius palmivorus]|uniref:Voltage-gated hydrogen channel 1 n=1 Tax=Paramarasmius palmivorus TaxID=297713 RepID=A0AAW0CZA6_9AGAR
MSESWDAEQQPLLDPENQREDREHVIERKSTFRKRLAEILESDPLHKTVIALVCSAPSAVAIMILTGPEQITIDAACVLADLAYIVLSPGCTPAGPDAPLWLEVLAHISLAITSFFLIEIPLALYAFGPHYYNPFADAPFGVLHVFDAIIIITTFILEVFLKGRERELASLLIVFRLWRLVKLVGGIAVGAGELGEEGAKELADTQRELGRVRDQLEATRRENQRLRERLNVAGLSEDD